MKNFTTYWVFICAFFYVSIHPSFAQNCPTQLPTPQWVRGGFLIPPNACIGQAVSVNDLSRGINIRYIYDYTKLSDTTRASVATAHVYPTAGRYLIVQIGVVNNRPSFACAVITVVATPKPTFSLTSCGNATARIIIPPSNSAVYGLYQINWGDGSPSQVYVPNQILPPTHTYAKNQLYMVSITGFVIGAACTGVSNSVAFTPVGTPPVLPTFTQAEALDETTAELTYLNPDKNLNYVLRQRIFPSPTLMTISNAITSQGTPDWKLKITGLRTSQNMYCYQLTSTANCAGSLITLTSNEICTMLLNVLAQPYQNVLVWRAYPLPPFKRYVVKRDGLTIATIAAAATATYTDTKVECGRKYKYQVIAEFTTTPEQTSLSSIKEVTTQPTAPPTALTNVLVTVRDDKTAQIAVTAVPAGLRVKRYIFKSADKELSGTARTLNDSTANPKDASVCYQVGFEDACGRVAPPSASVCTVHLEARGETLRWTSELPFTNALRRYVVQRLDAQGRVIRSEYSGINTEWEMSLTTAPEQEVIYRVQIVSANNLVSYSNIVRYFRPMKIFVPSAFTPNGDGNNETFQVKGQFITVASLTIYNRWGQAIFQTEDWKKGWDGNANGQLVEGGSYVYVVQATDTKGNAATQRGVVEVLR